MFPATKGQEAVTRIQHPARPAVGAEGHNVMKVIPVQRLGEKFTLTQMSKPQTGLTSPKAVAVNVTPVAAQRAPPDPSVTRFVRTQLGSVLSSKGDLNPGSFRNRHPPQEQPLCLKAKVPLMSSPAAKGQRSEALPGCLPVKPRLESVQTTSNNQVRVDSASERPPPVNKPLLLPSADPSFNLLYISPLNLLNPAVSPASAAASPSFKTLHNSSSQSSCGPAPPAGPRTSFKLISRVPQRPNSPIRWKIEEEDNSAPPPVPPSSSVASEILRAVAERERACKQPEVMKFVSPVERPGEEDAVVLCNGTVFKKKSGAFNNVKKDSSTEATKVYEFNKTKESPPQLAAPPRKPVYQCIIPRKSHEVIDLCDDDAQDDESQRAASQSTYPDEDNVLFTLCSPEDFTPKTQTSPVKEAERASEGGDGGRERKPHQMASKPVCGAGGEEQSAPVQQVESTGATLTSDSSSSCSTQTESWSRESSADDASCRMSRRLLRRMFGVTADVEICLQRVDDASAELRQEATSQTREELFSLDPDSPLGSDGYSEVSADSHAEPLRCSHLNPTADARCVLSNAQSDAKISYMEPIEDESFLHTDDKQDIATGTCPDKRRIGRTRKRTTCPCCVSGTEGQAATLAVKRALTTERARGKGGRKTARKRVVIRCPNVKKQCSDFSAGRGVCAASADFDELRCNEEIKRLRALLQEKEAALELMRKAAADKKRL